jgi:1A family penicillin-binding protein
MTQHKRASHWHAFLTALFVIGGVSFLAFGGVLVVVALTPTPDINSFLSRQLTQSTKIYDRTGQVLLYDYNRDAKRELVPLRDISPNAIYAVLAIEDAGFYDHGGIRLTSIIRAVIADVIGGSLAQGGSTITQQVVKNTLLTKKKSIIRKMHEWVLAIKLEQTYSKDQILEAYLNDVPFGGTLYGIESASEAYFGIPAKDLSPAQAAYLAAMIQAPSYYSPFGAHRTELDDRKNVVLERMSTLGFVESTIAEAAKTEIVAFSSAGRSAISAPHFVFYILDELEEKYGTTALTTGLKVTTTLDAELQTKAEEIVHRYALENEQKFSAKNAALIAIDPQTGQILSMIGSRDFFDTEIDGQYNATLALRQPGSTMKPFVYSLALMNGYTRNTIVFDTPTQFSTACNPSDLRNNAPPCYAPVNFDNTFRGPMTFETALAQSINIPALKVLYLVGISKAINFAKSFGLSTLGDATQYGLTIVLGGGEVRLLDLVGGYATFANGGVRNPPVGILEVSDAQGNIIAEYSSSPERVLPENIANDVSAMLSNLTSRGVVNVSTSPFSFPGYEVAAKTGTTNDTRDAWVIGYTPSIALGVWTGNNDNAPMVKSVAGFIAAPMWHEALAYALTKYPKTYFGEPTPIYSTVPPMLQGTWRMPDANGNVVPHDLLYWTDKNNPQGPPPYNPGNDPQFEHWEYGVSYWYNARPELFTSGTILSAPLTQLHEEGTTNETDEPIQEDRNEETNH